MATTSGTLEDPAQLAPNGQAASKFLSTTYASVRLSVYRLSSEALLKALFHLYFMEHPFRPSELHCIQNSKGFYAFIAAS